LYGLKSHAGTKLSKKQPSDAEFFNQAMSGVRPIKEDQRYREPVNRKTRPLAGTGKRNLSPDTDLEHSTAKLPSHDFEFRSDQPLSFIKPGFPRKLLRRLGSERILIEDSFDLHGMTEAMASKTLHSFVQEALTHELECIRIVHGKGLRSNGPPVLKIMSWNFLSRHPDVLAIKSCKPADGGTGALLALLRKKQALQK
jgi:DNA-nicking Smr family endonuclease